MRARENLLEDALVRAVGAAKEIRIALRRAGWDSEHASTPEAPMKTTQHPVAPAAQETRRGFAVSPCCGFAKHGGEQLLVRSTRTRAGSAAAWR